MPTTSVTVVRDFVYLDVERLKSIVAQVERGFLVETSQGTQSTRGVSAELEASVPFITKVGGTGQYLSTNQASETRTLHDHIYAHVEDHLLREGLVTVLEEELNQQSWRSNERRNALSDTSFVLVHGRPLVLDYEYLQDFMSEFNKLAAALGRASAQNEISLLPEPRRKAAQAIAAKTLQLDDQFIKDLSLILAKFVRHRALLRIMPFPSDLESRVSCLLDVPEAFRTSMNTLVQRFGSAPRGSWTVFGQIAAIPLSTDSASLFGSGVGGDLDQAIQKMFDALRSFEFLVGSVAYPDISVIPIAVYRGHGS